MSADVDTVARRAVALAIAIDPAMGGEHLPHDGFHSYHRRERIVQHRHGDAALDVRGRQDREIVLALRAPEAAEDDSQARVRSPQRRKDIEPLSRTGAVGDIELTGKLLARAMGPLLPAREILR